MCLQQMVEDKFGKAKWKNILEMSGLPKNHLFISNQQIDDNLILKVIGNTCEALDITLEQAADAFGSYWMTEFAELLIKSGGQLPFPPILEIASDGKTSVAKDIKISDNRLTQSSWKEINDTW